ncbi:MAG: PE-PPE domain-containing protein [Mycobacteriaceae bacterium]|nr:PE-PPE domain-containing protein [Mycobacteriaceae bacterium]
MTSVQAQPAIMTATATNVAEIAAEINAARSAAANWTAAMPAAAYDEVSSAAAALFNVFSHEYQALIGRADIYQSEFAELLTAASNAYAQTEAVAVGTLNGLTSQAQAEWVALTNAGSVAAGTLVPFTSTPSAVSLVMGGSGTPTPSQPYVEAAYNLFIEQNFPLTSPPVFNSNLLPSTTAEGLYPFTGIKDLTLNISLARGVKSLNNAIEYQLGQGHTPVTVFGYSQSTIVASLEMNNLVTAGVPTTDVNFVLIASPSNPNGGLLARFPGLEMPSLGLPFGISTPSDTGYQTVMYTREYDGFADFPRYPINILADVNALMGITSLHPAYLHLTHAEISSATQLATSPGYSGGTTYYMIPTEGLPLTDPLRLIPYFGDPLAEFLNGPLTPLINWGYGDPNYGYSTSYADVATPFGLFPPLSSTLALGPAVANGTQQGINAAIAEFQAQGPITLPALSAPDISGTLTTLQLTPNTLAALGPTSVQDAITNFLLSLQTANNNIVGGLTADLSTAYATILPLADITTAVVISLPSYNFDLFTDGLIQMVNGQPLVGLVNAIGMPIAADVGLVTLAGGFALISVGNSLNTILTGAPNPRP